MELQYTREFIGASLQKRCLPNSNTPPQAREASQCSKPPAYSRPESRAPPETIGECRRERTSRPKKEMSCAPVATIARSVHKPLQRADPALQCLATAHKAVRLVRQYR